MSFRVKLRSIGSLVLFAGMVEAQGETPLQFSWAQRGGGAGVQEAHGVAVDPSGNVLVTGYFTGTCSIGNTNLTSSGLEDIFLAKYDPSGNFLWARQAGGTGDDYGLAVATDPSGNVFVAGAFQNTATFSTTTLTSSRSNDVFLVKYGPAGNLLWARRAGGNGNEEANALAVDAAGNAYITGAFDANATFGTISLANNTGSDEIFVAKCSSAGDFLWALKAGGSLDDVGSGIGLDGATNVYVTGYFAGTATFGSTNLTSAGTNDYPDIFLAKYDAAGNMLWVRQAGGPNDDRGNGVAVDAAGNVSITGQFMGTAAFGSTNLIANGSGSDIFVSRYSSDGNLLWARRAGGNNAIYGDAGFSIVTDTSSNLFATGYFSGNASFGSSNLISAGFQNVFCCKYDPAGNVLWVRGAGGTLNDFGSGVAVNTQGNVVLAGFFLSSTITFDSITLTNTGSRDIFVAQLGLPIVPTLTIFLSNGQAVLSWPAAATGFILESASALPPFSWASVTLGTNAVGTNQVVTLPASEPQKFFRLRKP
jgi:hypothetical protein